MKSTAETIIECLDTNPDVAAEVWRHLTESQGLKDTLTRDRDEYKAAADMWQADALRDGAALEKVRGLLGTTVVAEKVPEVLENMLRTLSRPCPEVVNDRCRHLDTDCDPVRPCRRRGGHSGPHTSSLNEARALDAVVTHEDLKKLRDELIEALDAVTVTVHDSFGQVPAGFRELAQILREKKT